jgi:uncharacterized protein (TIGR00255 family)
MLRSMTGYGKGEASHEGWAYSLQVKSVNNRFLEAPLKLPSAFWSKEGEARALFQGAVSRGKIDLSWKETAPESASAQVSVNLELAASYRSALETLASGLALSPDIRLDQILRHPGVVSGAGEAQDEGSAEARWQGFRQALVLALADLQKSREREGAALEAELRALLAKAKELAAQIEKKSLELAPLFLDRLKRRVAAMVDGLALDDPRLLSEAALLTDKADIREEIVRFEAHRAEFARLLDEGGVAGKRLDFLCQELLREANTMGSKSPDAGLTQLVVALKAEIEKIKEQIQNLE